MIDKKPKRPRKRFTNREEIIKRIDKFTQKAQRQRDQQRQLYADAHTLMRGGGNRVDAIHNSAKKEVAGDKLGRKADRLEKDVLPALKGKLAEFDTDVIPGITDDRSVPGL